MTSLFGGGSTINVNVSGTLVPQAFIATSGQTVFTLTNFTYTINTNSLLVFINGTKQISGIDFTESSSSTFTLVEGAVLGDAVEVIGFPLATAQVLGTTPGDGTVTTAKIATGAVTTSKIADGTITPAKLDSTSGSFAGLRNRIINGAMVIDQRNAGASTTPTTDATYTLDRWSARLSVASKYSVQQGAATNPPGFPKALIVTSLAATSPAAGDFYAVQQQIEGFNTADFAWGTASAKTVTLSFWVRSSLTGTFGGAVRNGASNRSYPFTYTISAANTWEYKSVTIPGDTTGAWATDDTSGPQVFFGLGAGTTFSGTAGSWSGGNYLTATGAVSVVGTNAATWYVTGVQLELGFTATPFEQRPYGMELALCQRYYEISTIGYNLISFSGNVTNAVQYYATIRYAVTKRAVPSVLSVAHANAVSFPATASTLGDSGPTGFRLQRTANATAAGYFSDNWTSSAEL